MSEERKEPQAPQPTQGGPHEQRQTYQAPPIPEPPYEPAAPPRRREGVVSNPDPEPGH
jgi:hypothetical protein